MKLLSFVIFFIFLMSVFLVLGYNETVNETFENNVSLVNITENLNESLNITINETLEPFSIENNEPREIVYKEVIVKEKTPYSKTIKLKISNLASGEESVLPEKEWVVKNLSEEEISLLKLQGTEIAENREYKMSLTTSVPFINATEYSGINFNGTIMNGSGETVCILDTGVDYTHPALNDAYLGGYDYVNSDADPIDDNGHGTHVSGIVLSRNSTYQGVAYGAGLISIKVLNSAGSGTTATIANGINWCVTNRNTYNITVISMSLGESGVGFTSACDASRDDAIRTAVNDAVSKNITVVAAAGNDGYIDKISSPACLANVTSVGSVSELDSVSSFSDRASFMDLYAPGESITSAGTSGSSVCAGTPWGTCSGTSQATPHVAGSILLLNQFLRYYHTSPNSSLAVQALKNGGKDINNSGFVLPRIDLMGAYDYVVTYFGGSMNSSFVTNINGTKYNLVQMINVSINSTNNLDYCYLDVNGTNYNMTLQTPNSAINYCYINHTFNAGINRYRTRSVDTNGVFADTGYVTLDIGLTTNLTPSFPKINDTLNCNASVFTNATTSYYWYKNTTLQTVLNNITSISSTNLTINDVWKCSVISSFNGWNENENSSVSVVNSLFVTDLGNWSVNEGTIINITINVTNLENDTLTYSVNGSKFAQTKENFTWTTNYADYGYYTFKFNISDGINSTIKTIFVNLSEVEDFDNDGLNNSEDKINGTVTNLTSINNLTLRINGSTNFNVSLNETLKVNITDELNETLVELDWNFSNVLNMNFTINYNSSSDIIFVNGLDFNGTKTLFIDDDNFASLCVKNAEISDESNFSSDCTGTGEVSMTSCLGSAYNSSGLTCVDEGSRIRVGNLSYSGIKGTPTVASSGSSSSSGGGGGGGGSSEKKVEKVTAECVENWFCEGWGECNDGKKIRTCKDSNLCGTYTKQPDTAKKCEVEPVKENAYEIQENKTVEIKEPIIERRSKGVNGILFLIFGAINLLGATALLIYSRKYL